MWHKKLKVEIEKEFDLLSQQINWESIENAIWKKRKTEFLRYSKRDQKVIAKGICKVCNKTILIKPRRGMRAKIKNVTCSRICSGKWLHISGVSHKFSSDMARVQAYKFILSRRKNNNLLS